MSILSLDSNRVAKFSYDFGFYSLRLLLDTGAGISVFNSKTSNISDVFPDAYKLDALSELITPTAVYNEPVWIIPRLYIGGLRIDDLPVIVRPLGLKTVDFIISAHVFMRNAFTVDFEKMQLTIDDKLKVINCRRVVVDNKFKYFYVMAMNTDD